VQMPIASRDDNVALNNIPDLIGLYGGRTRDRTLDLSRVKGIPVLMFAMTYPFCTMSPRIVH